jgi:hypothetical protein
MKILKRSDYGYEQDPTKNFGFDKFNGEGSSDSVLIIAAFDEGAGYWKQFSLTDNEFKEIKKRKIVRLEFEEPNKFFIKEDFDLHDNDFYKVFTLCHFSADYLNRQQACERRIPIFFPFNANFIPPKEKKRYDIIYTGHINSKYILQDIKKISKFNYRFVSNSSNHLVTNRGVGYKEKISLISKSRITLVHNLLYPTFKHLLNVWKYEDWQTNLAFSELPSLGEIHKFVTKRKNMVVPQLKSRAFEAAFSRSLILCKRDPFNIIENFFEPNKQFVYYEEGHLEKVINDILNSYDDYLPIIESAFNRACNEYTTDVFFEKYLRDI